MAAHSSVLAWRIPQTEEPGGLQSLRSQRTGHNRGTERARMCGALQAALVANSIPVSAGDTRDVGSSPESGRSHGVFLPGEFPGQRSSVGYSPWGHKKSDTTQGLDHSVYTSLLVSQFIAPLASW